MAKMQFSSKKIQIDKAQATIVSIIAGAVFVTVFSLVSSKALWTQRSYQAKVLSKKQQASDQLEDNIQSVDGLVASYKTFVSAPTNFLQGNPTGQGEKDGDNARLVLDALPSKYDFPALTASLEKILTDRKFKVDSITGVDNEVAQAGDQKSGDPKPVDMPFQLGVSGSYTSIQDLIGVFEHSIRPFSIQKIALSGGTNDMKMTIDAKTYYQPEKTLDIKKETVK